MRTLRDVTQMRKALDHERIGGRTVALVPTMGALHDGHLSLIRSARATHDVVVVSLFVNPAQFNEQADLAAYPRDEQRDALLAERDGADVLFAPGADDVYPDGFATSVVVSGPLTETLEGEHRGAAHFHGVTTVVTKLLNMVRPDAAFFGAKDAQQLRVVRRLVRDLDMGVEIVGCPTVREPSGLALSSRNAQLSDTDREHALGLSRALREIAEGIADQRFATRDEAERAGRAALREHGTQPEYFSIVEPETMALATGLDGELLIVTAAHVGAVRLIDNLALTIATPTTGGIAGSTHTEAEVPDTNQIIDIDAEVATLLA